MICSSLPRQVMDTPAAWIVAALCIMMFVVLIIALMLRHNLKSSAVEPVHEKVMELYINGIARDIHCRCFLELAMQSKHDRVVRGECKNRQLKARRPDRSQILHCQGASFQDAKAFYERRASSLASFVVERIQAAINSGAKVERFLRHRDVIEVEWSFDASFIYTRDDDADHVEIRFHCFPRNYAHMHG